MTIKTCLKSPILITIVSLYILRTSAEGISCFKCTATPPEYEDEDNLLCSQFDGSAKFQVFCPSSTLCMKRTIYHKLKHSVITVVERSCAPQKLILPIYNSTDNLWYDREEIVKTAYEEGCFMDEDRGAQGKPSEYCVCSFHLCNSSDSMKLVTIHHICLVTILSVIAKFL